MTVYLINLAVVTISSILYAKPNFAKSGQGLKKKYFLMIILLSLIVVAGFRYKVGTDFITYTQIYADTPTMEIDFTSEVGFTLLLKLLYSITSNFQILFFVTSIIINVGVILFLKTYSDEFPLSVYLYITTFSYYGSMNGVRQYIASVMLVFALKHIMSGNFKKYLIYVMIAFLFHTSALVMIPVYFLVRRKVDSKANIYITCGFVGAFIFYQPFVNIMFEVLKNSRYGDYESTFTNPVNGVNILRLVVWAIPIAIMFINKEKAREIYGEKIDIIINLCFLGILFLFLAVRHVYFARISIYFSMYNLLLIPKLCKMFNKKTNVFLTYMVIICYFLYSTLLLMSGESNILPYKYNFNLL